MQDLLSKTQEIKLENALYIVATPIGNLGDITIRALQVLNQADVIICEDTRVSKKIFSAYNVKEKKLFTYNDHGDDKIRQKILNFLLEGKSVALVSDAGTPLISDPGYKLVHYLRQCGQKIVPIPGASALNSALCASGLACDNFLFVGFLPTSLVQKEKLLKSLPKNFTFIVFESANRVVDSLKVIFKNLGDRNVCVARELTKMHEEIISDPLSKVIGFFDDNQNKLRGEFVILVEKLAKNADIFDENELKQDIKKAISLGHSLKDLSQNLAEIYGLNKKKIYQMALDLNN